MAGLARWCFHHRRMVVAFWLLALLGFLVIGRSVGSVYTNSFSLPGTDSQHAQDVLKADFPAQAGDSDQIVVHAKQGTLRSPATRAAVTAMLARVDRLPHVRSVNFVYASNDQISADGKIGFATVTLDAPAQDIPKTAARKLITTAQSADSPKLDIELSGAAIESNQRQSGNTSLLAGIVLALIVLFFAFRRSILGAVLPLISALVAIGVGTSIITILTHAMSVASFTSDVTVLVALGVGIDYALFIVSRHRAGLLRGRTVEEAAITALNTSGRAVLLAGSTVSVALLGLFALQVSFLYGVAVSVALAVVLTMLASLTLLPAMLGFFGLKVLHRKERAMITRYGAQPDQIGTFWSRWADWLDGNAVAASGVALGVIALLALPFFGMRQGLPDASTDPTSSTTHRAYDLLARGFGSGFGGPLQVVAQVHGPADRARFGSYVASLRSEPGVARVQPPRPSPNNKAEIAVVYPTTSPQQTRTTDLLHRVRATARREQTTTLAIHIGGDTAVNADFSHVLTDKMPQFLGIVVSLAFLLLLVVFRSLLVPLTASVMNLLSFGVALGVMTATFQYGWGTSVLGLTQSGPIVTYLPVMMFAILFGLSMDYEIFLVSRMHEEWLIWGDNDRAVTRGQAQTGRVITAAALIMILVFASFILGSQMDIKQIGLGFAAAIFVDAFIIRTVLVPATMHLFGRANWWLPRPLEQRLPRLHVEPTNTVSSGHAHVPTG